MVAHSSLAEIGESGHSGSFPLLPGTIVEVRVRFDGTWARGFTVDALTGDGYVIRRLSDGSLLPEVIAADDLHPTRGQVAVAGSPARRRVPGEAGSPANARATRAQRTQSPGGRRP